jgi:hypothetical protein
MLSLLSNRRNFWQKFEERVLEVIDLAVSKFHQIDKLPTEENDLNRLFFFALVEANYELQKINRGLESPPVYEGNNQPHFSDPVRASRESKRPDFQWGITDIYEAVGQRSAKQFVLECKRLGFSTNNWILNENYIHHGILRFVSSQHAYGLGMESAAMLGYIQSMSDNDILQELNSLLKGDDYPELEVKQTNKARMTLNHILTRESDSSSLRLEHIWMKLAHRYIVLPDKKDKSQV